LVTGASSGIGYEFCLQLAAAGFNLVMVARREAILQKIAKELSNKFEIQTLVITQDLSIPDGPKLVYAQTKANNIKIRLLVNNAGIGKWGKFESSSVQGYQEMISLNTSAIVSLCHLFLADLSSFTRSNIINVSSPAAFQPVPFMAVYAATKSFVQSFSQALYGELVDRGVYVQTLIPGPTKSEFDIKAGAYESDLKTWDPPEKVVRVALQNLISNDPLVIIAKGTYKQRFFAGLFPAKIVIKAVGKMFSPPII
jgi:short-subunit dehydrogenase